MAIEHQPTASDGHAEATAALVAEPQPPDSPVTPKADGRCGARTAEGDYCQSYPETGRSRCRLHGGLTPTGRDSPHFVHGRDSKYAVPLSEDERIRFEQYKSAVFDQKRDDLAGDLALARIQRDRAMTAGSSGVKESDAVARLASTHARITAGRTIRIVPDEAATRALLSVIYGALREAAEELLDPATATALKESVARKILAID